MTERGVDRPAVQRFAKVMLDWLGHPKVIGDPGAKIRPLNAAERGTWLTALLLGHVSHPGPVSEAMVWLVCPDASFAELYARGLLDRTGKAGWFTVHDLGDYRVSWKPSAQPEAVRERKRRSRAAKKAPIRAQSVTRGHTMSREVTPRGEETRGEETREERHSVAARPLRGRRREAAGPAANVTGFTRPLWAADEA